MTTTNIMMLFVLVMSIILAIGVANAYEKTEHEILSHEKKDSAGSILEKTDRDTLSHEKRYDVGSTRETTEHETLSKEKRDIVGSTHEKTERETSTHETQDGAGLSSRVKTQSEKLTYEKHDNAGKTREKTYTERLTQEKTSDDKSSHEYQHNVESTHEKTENVASTRGKIDSLRSVTRDAIGLAIREIGNTEKFINDIPWLHTLELSESMALVTCVAGLTECLGEGQGKLGRMRRLDQATLPFDDSDVKALKGAVLSRVASFNDICRIGLKNVDKTVAVMLNRKLEDVKLLASNVIKYVSELKLNN